MRLRLNTPEARPWVQEVCENDSLEPAFRENKSGEWGTEMGQIAIPPPPRECYQAKSQGWHLSSVPTGDPWDTGQVTPSELILLWDKGADHWLKAEFELPGTSNLLCAWAK